MCSTGQCGYLVGRVMGNGLFHFLVGKWELISWFRPPIFFHFMTNDLNWKKKKKANKFEPSIIKLRKIDCPNTDMTRNQGVQTYTLHINSLVNPWLLNISLVLISFFFLYSLKDFKEFVDAMDAVKDKGVVVAVASQEDVEAANNERTNFFEIKKAL